MSSFTEQGYTPRTINLSDASGLDLSCTELTNFSSDESDNSIESNSSDDEIEVQVTQDSLIFHKSVTRDDFWKMLDRYGDIENFPNIHWGYSEWNNLIPEDLEHLRNSLAHFNFHDPWPDIYSILNSDTTYPNLVTIRCVNLCQVLNPLIYVEFLSKFPNLRQISFARPSAYATLSLRKLVQLTKTHRENIYLELLG